MKKAYFIGILLIYISPWAIRLSAENIQKAITVLTEEQAYTWATGLSFFLMFCLFFKFVIMEDMRR